MAEGERFEVDRPGAVLVGERWGLGDPVVVILHEGVTDRRAWRPVASILAAAIGEALATTG